MGEGIEYGRRGQRVLTETSKVQGGCQHRLRGSVGGLACESPAEANDDG